LKTGNLFSASIASIAAGLLQQLAAARNQAAVFKSVEDDAARAPAGSNPTKPRANIIMDAYARLPRAAPEEVGMSSVRLERARRKVRGWVDTGAQPNHSLLIARAGKVVLEDVYGSAAVADVPKGVAGRPLQPDAIFRWASMTKPVTAVAAMICYEAGCFQLDDALEVCGPPFLLD
jgi:CubicO group peptidase (beta-lactamase class C family)